MKTTRGHGDAGTRRRGEPEIRRRGRAPFLAAAAIVVAGTLYPAAAWGQAVDIQTHDGGTTPTSRMQFTSGAAPTTITVLNARMLFSSAFFTLPTGTSDPTDTTAGNIYYNSSTGRVLCRDGTGTPTWRTLSYDSGTAYVRNQASVQTSAAFYISNSAETTVGRADNGSNISNSIALHGYHAGGADPNTAIYRYGVRGESVGTNTHASSTNVGVYGTASGSSGLNIGLKGEVSVVGGRAVEAVVTGDNQGIGVAVLNYATGAWVRGYYGFVNGAVDAGETRLGIEVDCSPATTTGSSTGYGAFITAQAAATNIGAYARAIGGTTGGTNIGLDSSATGDTDSASTNYGLRTSAQGNFVGSTTYGVYSTVSGSGALRAGYFAGGAVEITATSNQLILGTTNQLTLTASPTTTRTITLPDATGTTALGTGTTNYAAYWSGTNALAGEANLAVSRGGTGAGTFTSYGVLYGNGTSAIGATAGGSTGQVLVGNTGAAPSWGTVGSSGVTADSLDYAHFEDTLDLDAALTLNQTTYAWTQSFTGTTTTGLSYTANSLTTGKALNIATSSNPAAAGPISPIAISLTNANATTATTVYGVDIGFTNSPTIAGNSEYVARIQNKLTANITDNAVAALLLLDNADTTATGTTVVTDAIKITNSGGAGFTNLLETPSVDISSAGAVSGVTTIGMSGALTSTATSNQLVLYGSTNQLTISSGSSAAARVYTVPDVGTTGTFAMLQAQTFAETQTFGGSAVFNGVVTLGDNGDTVAVNSSDWDISTTGNMTGIGAITTDGNATLGDATTDTMTCNGAVTTSKLNKVVVVDGVNYTTIQAALNALPSTGGEVFVPEGTYTITSAITFPYGNITLRGAGYGSVVSAASTSGINLISVNGTCTIRDLKLRFTALVDTTANYGISNTSSAQENDVRILNCRFENCTRGINLTPSNAQYFCQIKDNLFSSSGYAIYTDPTSNIQNSIITGNTVWTTSKAGFYFQDLDDSVVSNNNFYGVDSGFYDIRLDTGCSTNTVVGNNTAGSTGVGISDGGTSNTLTGNN